MIYIHYIVLDTSIFAPFLCMPFSHLSFLRDAFVTSIRQMPFCIITNRLPVGHSGVLNSPISVFPPGQKSG